MSHQLLCSSDCIQDLSVSIFKKGQASATEARFFLTADRVFGSSFLAPDLINARRILGCLNPLVCFIFPQKVKNISWSHFRFTGSYVVSLSQSRVTSVFACQPQFKRLKQSRALNRSYWAAKPGILKVAAMWVKWLWKLNPLIRKFYWPVHILYRKEKTHKNHTSLKLLVLHRRFTQF